MKCVKCRINIIALPTSVKLKASAEIVSRSFLSISTALHNFKDILREKVIERKRYLRPTQGNRAKPIAQGRAANSSEQQRQWAGGTLTRPPGRAGYE